MRGKRRIVIVGGVAAGMSAASQARKRDADADIVVLERGPDVSYGACGLPYLLSGLVRDWRALVHYTPERFSEERGVSVLVQHEATEVDLGTREVRVRAHGGAGKTFPFDSLVLATGARPFVPDLPGTDLAEVFTLRSLVDGRRLDGFLERERPRHACVVGGGLLGLELAEAFVTRGIQVTVLEREEQLVPDMDPSMAVLVTDELLRHGVAVRTGATVMGLDKASTGVRVSMRAGSIDADFLVFATGVLPNSELAAAAGVSLGAARAIAVDEGGRTSQEGVWAAGDCAEVTYVPSGERVYLPAGNTSNKQGRVAGVNAAGGRAEFPGVVGTRVGKVFDLEVARTGLSTAQADRLGSAHSTTRITAYSRAAYYPRGSEIAVTVIAQRGSGRLLGAQLVGAEGCSKRVDTFATALHAGLDLDEVAALDLSYSPPFAPAWDPVLIAAREAAKEARASGR